jgi:hypothetical protein
VVKDQAFLAQHDRVEVAVNDLEVAAVVSVAVAKVVLRSPIFASPMHRRRISKPRNVVVRANSDSLQRLPSMTILSDARRV